MTPPEGAWAPEPGEVLSVGELLGNARRLVEESFAWVWVEGEIRDLRVPGSGHAYFSLGSGGAQVRSVCFRSVVRLLPRRLEEGQRVLARGRLTLYEARGDLQLIVEDLEPLGSGVERLGLEARKRRLAAEGLFSTERKRPLPHLPRAVGLITSASGAALGDVVTVLRRRAPGVRVCLAPARVQGRSAPEELREALALATSCPEIDVVILGRGGGSSEDLSAFNDEGLVRAIAASPVPVVSAVGHEADVTLADLVADARAPTPSAAAEMVVRDWEHWGGRLKAGEGALLSAVRARISALHRGSERLEARIASPSAAVGRFRYRVDRRAEELDARMGRKLAVASRDLGAAELRLVGRDPRARLGAVATRLTALEGRLAAASRTRVDVWSRCLAAFEGRLAGLDPTAVLSRGYAVVSRDGFVLTDAAACSPGDAVRARLARGSLDCLVVTATPDPLEEG